jgi:glycosyltransferase involved in cell wall biosynthesis
MEPEMKILFLEYSAGGERGGEHVASHLHEFLRRNFSDIEPPRYELRPKKLNRTINATVSSLALVRRHHPDLIVLDVSSGMRNVMAVYWMKRQGRRVLVEILDQRMTYKLNNFFPVKWFIRRCERYIARNADVIVVESHYISRLAAKMAGKPIPIVIALPGMEFPENTAGWTPDLRKTNPRKIVLLNAGEPSERKGTIYLVEAMARLKKLNLHLNITGTFYAESKYCQKLKRLIEQHGLADKITFHGYIERESLLDLYRRCSIFVLPSLSEGYGIAMAEALYFGMPVIASNVAAIPEMITDGVNGMLIPPRDSISLAKAIEAMANDSAMRLRMAEANASKALQLPRWGDFDIALEKSLLPEIKKFQRTDKKEA